MQFFGRNFPTKTQRSCLDCGFWGYGNREVLKAARVDFNGWVHGSWAPNHRLEGLNCSEGRWVTYDLTYVGTAADGIQDELTRNRNKCEGFMRHRAGFSPAEHKEMKRQRWLSRWNLVMTLSSGIIGGTIVAILNWMLTKFL